MLRKHSVFNAHNVCGNPIRREAEVRKSSVRHDDIPFGHNRSVLIFEARRKALNETEHTLTTERNVGAMLDVVEALAVAEVLYLQEQDKIDAVIIASDVPEV